MAETVTLPMYRIFMICRAIVSPVRGGFPHQGADETYVSNILTGSHIRLPERVLLMSLVNTGSSIVKPPTINITRFNCLRPQATNKSPENTKQDLLQVVTPKVKLTRKLSENDVVICCDAKKQ